MQIAMSYSGTLTDPAAARSIEQRLLDLEAELQQRGLVGSLSISDTDKYDPE